MTAIGGSGAFSQTPGVNGIPGVSTMTKGGAPNGPSSAKRLISSATATRGRPSGGKTSAKDGALERQEKQLQQEALVRLDDQCINSWHEFMELL